MSKVKYRKNNKLGVSTAEAIARTLGPKKVRQPKQLKVLDNKASEIEPIIMTPEISNNYINLKDKITLKELSFLEIYFVGGETIDSAMIKAGYGDMSWQWRYELAQKIVRKYEAQAEDTRKIFQDIGFGQLTIAQGIKNKALNAKSEMVSLNAYQLAARCTRMLEEPQASHQGVNIIINCGTEPAGGAGAPARPVNVSIQGEALPSKPLQITK